MDTLARTGSLSDPASCGEDLEHNLQRALAIAPLLCGGCEDYHATFAANRMTGDGGAVETDRPELIVAIGMLVTARAAVDREPIDIVIVGSADTGVLATAAHAAYRAGANLLSRVRFTVLDVCRTPLELCRDYAARHGLALAVEAVDLVETDRVFPADIVLHHSFLGFAPASDQDSILRKFGRWLKPGGRIVFSNSLRPTSAEEARRAHRSAINSLIQSMIETGAIRISEPRERFYARLDGQVARVRPGKPRMSDPELVRCSFRRANLSILSLDVISRPSNIGNAAPLIRDRILAILERQDSD